MDESVRLLCHPFLLSISAAALSLWATSVICLCTGLCHTPKRECSFTPLPVTTQHNQTVHAFLKQLHVNDSLPLGELGCFVVLRHRDVC